MKKETSLIHDMMILVLITLVAGMLLGVVYSVTKEPIETQKAATRMAMEQAVFEDAVSFEVLLGFNEDGSLEEALLENGLDQTTVNQIDGAFDEGGNLLGYVVDVTNAEGYGGDVEIMVGIRTEDGSRTINGISFLNLEETAGLGMKAKEEPFMSQFVNLSGEELISFTKTGKTAENEIDAIGGATITTTAVTKDVNAALTAIMNLEGGE